MKLPKHERDRLARQLLHHDPMGARQSIVPPAGGTQLLRQAEQLRARGEIREAIDTFRGAAATFQAEGRQAHASAALSTAFRLATCAPHADYPRTATIATDLADVHRTRGLLADAAEVIRQTLELLVPSGNLGLAMNVARWAVDAARVDPRFSPLKAHALSSVGVIRPDHLPRTALAM